MNGIINLKKEAGMTSHDAVFKLRKILGTKKIGHGGTLDPDVVGVLPIAVGKATRMVEFMQDEGKIYEGEITLGYSTTTEDASGEVVAETPVLSPLDEKLVDEAIASLTGPITQIPLCIRQLRLMVASSMSMRVLVRKWSVQNVR